MSFCLFVFVEVEWEKCGVVYGVVYITIFRR